MEAKVCSKCRHSKPKTKEYFREIKNKPCGFKASCIQCDKEYDAKRYQANKEKIYKRTREWVKNNPDKARERARKYYWDNHERSLELKRKYTEKNRETLKERSSLYREKNLEKEKARQSRYRKANLDKENIRKIKRKTLKENLYSNFSSLDWISVVEKFNNKCAYCGTEDKLTQEHFIPLTKGGEYTINNIIPACVRCNCSKNNRDFFEWYPKQRFYSKEKEKTILNHLNYKGTVQQTALF